MKKFFLTALLISVLCGVSYGTDIPITPTGPVFKLLPAPTWGVSGPTGFNNNFFFTPLSQNESVCVFVKNNNTTNPHTFTASISINSDPANTTPSDGTWQVGASSSGLFAATSPGQPSGIGVSVSGASQVSVNFSASSTQAGAPETANIVIVQSTGNCFAGNQFIGSAPQTVNSVPPIQSVSEGLSQAFSASNTVTNPVAAFIVHINANNGAKSLYFDKLFITCSATCTLSITASNSLGTGCAAVTIGNEKLGSTVTPSAVAQSGCTGGVGTNFLISGNLILSPGVPFYLDLKGIIAPSNTVNGVSIFSQTFTGVIAATTTWYEK